MERGCSRSLFGELAAVIYTIRGTAKVNDLIPESYLRYILARIAGHTINHIDELLPWNFSAKLLQLRIAT